MHNKKIKCQECKNWKIVPAIWIYDVCADCVCYDRVLPSLSVDEIIQNLQNIEMSLR